MLLSLLWPLGATNGFAVEAPPCQLESITSTIDNWYISWKYDIGFTLSWDKCWESWYKFEADIYDTATSVWTFIWEIRPTDNSISSYAIPFDTTIWPNSDSSKYKLAVWCYLDNWDPCENSWSGLFLGWSIDSSFWIDNSAQSAVQNWQWDNISPVISFSWFTSPVSQSELPASLPLTVTDNKWVALVKFAESWTSYTWTLIGNWDIYLLPLPNSIWEHSIEVKAKDAAWNSTLATVLYTVVADSAITITAITISPANPTVSSWSSLQLTAVATDQSWAIISPSPQFSWVSLNPSVVSVNASWSVTWLSAWTGLISATSSGVDWSTVVTVTSWWWGWDTTPPVISFTWVTWSLRQSELPVSIFFSVTDDVWLANVTYSEIWTTNSWTIFWWNFSIDLNRTLWLHEFLVTATDLSGNVSSATISYTVIPDFGLSSIVITPANPTVSSWSSLQLTAVAVDQSWAIISPAPEFSWTSGNASVVSVNSSWSVTWLSAWTGLISATSSGVTWTVVVTVTSWWWGWDITPPGISYIWLPAVMVQSEVPASLLLTVTDDVSIASVTFTESWTTNSWALTLSWSEFPLPLSNAIGIHSYSVTATDTSGNIASTIVSYTVVTSVGVNTILINPANPTVNLWSTLQLMATMIDQSWAIISPAPEFSWVSLQPSVVSVSASWLVSWVAAWTGLVSATSSWITWTTLVTVFSPGWGWDTTPPVITFSWLTSPVKQGQVPPSIALTITDNVWIVSLVTYQNWASSWTLVSPYWVYTLMISNALWEHSYVVTAKDAAWNSTSATISYTVVSDQGFSISITPANPIIRSGASLQLTASAISDTWAIITPAPIFTWTSWNAAVFSVTASWMITWLSEWTWVVSATSSWVTWTTLVTISSSWALDTDAPVISFTWIVSPVKQSQVPAALPLMVTDDVWVVSVTFTESWATNSWTLTGSWNEYLLPLSNVLWFHSYLVTARDAAWNSSQATISYTVITDVDVTAPEISYTPIASQFNQAAVPANLVLTVTDDVWVVSVTFTESWATNSWTLTGSWNEYLLPLSNVLWFHSYLVTARDAAWNSSQATIAYMVVADSVLNMNILWYELTDLTSTWLTISWTTDKVAQQSLVDFYANGTQLLDQAATMSWTLNSLTVSNLVPNKVYAIVLKSRTPWQQNFTTLTLVIKTSASDMWLVVNKIETVLWSDPVSGWDFSNWYHFRFTVTANNMSESWASLRLADWSNGAATLPIAWNTMMSVSANGYDNFASASGSAVAVTDSYSAFQNISQIDSNPELWWRQFIIDLFYKIPSWAQWVYSTSYWIKTQ